MPVTHSWSGSVRAKSRSTRSWAIRSGRGRRQRGAASDTADAGAGHQHLDRIVPDQKAPAQGEFGVHPPRPVGAVRGGVRVADLIEQPRVTDRPLRRRPRHGVVIADSDTASTRVASCTGKPSPAITPMTSNRLVGPPQQLAGPPVDHQLNLQLRDPTLGRS